MQTDFDKFFSKILEKRKRKSYIPSQRKFLSQTDHIWTMMNGAQHTTYASTMTNVILTVLSLALDMVLTLLTELFPTNQFLHALFLVLHLMFLQMLWYMKL